jgi:hypothetical protein
MLEDLFETILEGAGSQQQLQRRRTSGDPLIDMLGSILEGAGSQPQRRQSRTEVPDTDPLSGILGGILGGGAESQGAGGMGDLLEAILAGGATAPQPAPRRRSTPPSGGGLGDILGSILGGSSIGSNSFLAPIIEALAEKLGLPPAIAQMVISFVLSKLLSGAASRAQAPAPQPSRRARPTPVSPGGLDLDHLLEQMGTERGLDSNYLMSTGMAQELSQQTGLDAETAARSLQEALNMMLGSQVAASQPKHISQPKPGSLDNLLDTW